MKLCALLASVFVAAPLLAQDAPPPAPVEVSKQSQEAKKGTTEGDTKSAADPSSDPSDPLAGHSYHGEAFNEGARQRAYLMEGSGRIRVDFPCTSSSEEAKKFVAQGLGQYYGFWYFESERSFRQAAALDPDCAIAYWGMAMSNINNSKRAKGFLAEAMKRRDKASDREKMYIDGLNKYLTAKATNNDERKKRKEAFTKSFEEISLKHPEDIEAKALLALHLWKDRTMVSYIGVDAILQQVLDKEPLHPCHHFRIHLWDYKSPALAVRSAAKCGQAAPAIAHMWHMPGHIFSRLKRYNDAVWQQEASARVDHAHMMRDRVLPDQIHNFAHNNEWLIRNLNYVGRVNDALDLAKNMTELPRHPKYNTLTRRGSAYYGRTRLFETLIRYEQWSDLVAYSLTPYLEPTENSGEQVKRLQHLGTAHYRLGNVEAGDKQLAEVEKLLAAKKSERDKKVEAATAKAKQDKKDEKQIKKAEQDARRPFDRNIRELEQSVSALKGFRALAEGDAKQAHDLLKKGRFVDRPQLMRIRYDAGEQDAAIDELVKYLPGHRNEVQPLATLVGMLFDAGRKNEARKRFDELRAMGESIDLDASPVFGRLAPVAKEFGFAEKWLVEKTLRDDIGERPDLDSLGPFRWRPSPAPEWTLADVELKKHSLKDYRGEPVVVIFYLGYGCLHCAEQLQAFAPMTETYKKEGINLIAISTDDQDGLKESFKNYEPGKMPITLLSDSKHEIFKSHRVYDDFEKLPLHATFVLDEEGMVLWQDVSYEPFMDPKFVLKEAKRLLTQQKVEPKGKLTKTD
ncbi:MAG: redoxin domain-containing protein [Pirellulaceae bacterium]|jgi:peroxiredoxin|nr:redoxin domain-containing protein [Pirellulaceae bacterium]